MPTACSGYCIWNKAHFINRVLTKKRLRCWTSQGKSHFCKGEQSTWDLKPSHALGTGLGSWKDLASSGRWSSRNLSVSTSLALLPWMRPASDLIVQLSYRLIQPLIWKEKQAALWAFIPSPWFQAQVCERGRSLSLIYQTTFPFRDPDLSFCPLVFVFSWRIRSLFSVAVSRPCFLVIGSIKPRI